MNCSQEHKSCVFCAGRLNKWCACTAPGSCTSASLSCSIALQQLAGKARPSHAPPRSDEDLEIALIESEDGATVTLAVMRDLDRYSLNWMGGLLGAASTDQKAVHYPCIFDGVPEVVEPNVKQIEIPFFVQSDCGKV